MPAPPSAVDPAAVDPAATDPSGARRPRPRRRRRFHPADVLVLGVVIVLVGGFGGARRFGLAPRQPVPATTVPTTVAPVVAAPATTPPTTTPPTTAAPTTTTTVPTLAARSALDFAVALPVPPGKSPFALRAPDADAPVRVLVVGDSLATGLGRSLGRLGAAEGGVAVRTMAVAASGLARPDVFDWPNAIGSTVEPDDELVVVFLGLNDAQALSRTGAPVGAVGSATWTAAYRDRVRALVEGAGPRPVLLVGLPAVENPTRDRELQAVRAALYAEAAQHANVRYLDVNAQVSDGGRFLRYIDGGDGTEIVARSNDGEQFTDAGNEFLARAAWVTVWPAPIDDEGAEAG